MTSKESPHETKWSGGSVKEEYIIKQVDDLIREGRMVGEACKIVSKKENLPLVDIEQIIRGGDKKMAEEKIKVCIINQSEEKIKACIKSSIAKNEKGFSVDTNKLEGCSNLIKEEVKKGNIQKGKKITFEL